jgi:hypothetical protein
MQSPYAAFVLESIPPSSTFRFSTGKIAVTPENLPKTAKKPGAIKSIAPGSWLVCSPSWQKGNSWEVDEETD